MGNLFRSPSIRTRRSGFTLLEAVLLVVILSVISLGASIGMQSAAKIPASVDNLLALNRQVASTMEQLKASAAASFASLAGYSDTVTINGSSFTRTVTVTPLNAPDGSGATSDYVQITVQVGNVSATTFVTQP